MGRLLALTLFMFIGIVSTAEANTAVLCVQEQLTALGEDPGPSDGEFGRKTAVAFAGLLAREADKVKAIDAPEFSQETADVWCTALGGAFTEAGVIYERFKDALESGFTFDIAPNASPKLVAEIKEGLDIARSYIAKTFGADIPLEVRRKMIVKIVATGNGNTERAGGGGVATAFSEGFDVPRPFFDVAHEQWSQNTSGRGWSTHADNMKSVVHEYTHGWQMVLGAIDIHHQPLGNWLNEGLAEYVGYSAMVDAGLIKWRDAQIFMTRAASGVETDYPLARFGSTQTPAWAGHVGFVALDWLITDTSTGIAAIKTLAERVAAGRTQRQAFADTFRLDIDDFYEQFDQYAKSIRKNPDRALARRPALILTGGGVKKPTSADPLAAEKCIQAALNASGFKVGAVDGQIGNGTRAAFETYRSGLDVMARSIPFEKGMYRQWCFLMTGNAPLTGDAATFQAQTEQGARVVLGFRVPEGASFHVLMRKGEQVLAELDSPQWDKQAGEYSAAFDYSTVRQADNVCAMFKGGWLVKDRAGETYEASCDKVIPAMSTGGKFVWSYELVAPAANNEEMTPEIEKLETKGDPNPGLDLIPNGWNGIYRAAEQKGEAWEAMKYSGEVDTYQNCRLLNDTYIICQ